MFGFWLQSFHRSHSSVSFGRSAARYDAGDDGCDGGDDGDYVDDDCGDDDGDQHK